MHWTEPADATDSHSELETRLWAAANQLWANAALKPSEFSPIVLGLIFLRYADIRFSTIEGEMKPAPGSRRQIGPADYHARGVLYLPEEARFSLLLKLPEGAAVGQAVNEAMRAVERENPDLADVLPKTYQILENRTLAELLKVMASIPMDKGGDTFGLIYEYFLGKFAMSEGQKGGEFYTPTSIVHRPSYRRDPRALSRAHLRSRLRIGRHVRAVGPICGESPSQPHLRDFRLRAGACHRHEPPRPAQSRGPRHQRRHPPGNAYYEDLHDSVGEFDFVLANPPFNVSQVDKERIADDPRYPFGLPRTDNGNYLWIQHFYSALNDSGRAGFVMANSAADARASEQDIREQLIRSGHVDVMVSIGSNFFFTVTLPCTLWFFDKGKTGTPREDTVLFLDARHIYRQLDRAHRDFTPAQIEFLANVVRLYRGAKPEFEDGSREKIREIFLDGRFADVPGLCKAATRAEIEGQGWSLNPGRYVGVAKGEDLSDEDFKEKLEALNEELEVLNVEARELEERIAANVAEILETA